MRKIRVFLTALAAAEALTVTAAAPAFAGQWKMDAAGYWWQDDDGSYSTSEWRQVGDAWYFFDGNGYLLTNQWSEIGGMWYYFNDSGAMAANQWIGNYYVGSDGAMLTNTTPPDGYQVGADGAWIQSTGTSDQTAASSDDDFLVVTLENFLSEVVNSDELVLLIPWTPEDHDYLDIVKEIVNDGELSDLKIAKINIDEESELAEQYVIWGDMLFYEKGDCVGYYGSGATKQEVRDWLVDAVQSIRAYDKELEANG